MLKLGVVSRSGLRRPRTLLGRRRHVSFLLLRELASRLDVNAEEYDRLVGYAPMPNGVWKRTRHGRLRILDELVSRELRCRVAKGTPLTICDLAASTGTTSLDLYWSLKRDFVVDFVATDLYRDVFAVRRSGGHATVIFDAFGNAVQYVLGRFVLPAGFAESIAYPVNRTIGMVLRAVVQPRAQTALAQADLDAIRPFEPIQVAEHEIIRLPILTGETLGTLRDAEDFRFEVADVLAELPWRAHVVRAMNILTRDHFSATDRVRALRNCVAALLPGGMFVVGWSPTPDPSTVEASMYVVEPRHLVRLFSLNGGSEIDDLVEQQFLVVDSAGQQVGRSRGQPA